MTIAERTPARVYAHTDAIAALLDSSSKIVRWNAMRLLESLVAVDKQGRLGRLLPKCQEFIDGADMVSAVNAIHLAARIAQGQPALMDTVVQMILRVEHATYRTAECRNVAIGQSLDVLAELGPQVCGRWDVVAFVRRQRANSRAAVARRAAAMCSG